jgi:hypothetical protein
MKDIKFILVLLILLKSAICSSQMVVSKPCKIAGTVTYLFNKYQGNRADAGAKIYIFDANSHIAVDFESIYSQIKAEEKYAQGTISLEELHKYDSRASNQIRILKDNAVVKGIANGVGDYAISLKDFGEYYVLIQSANRPGESIAFISGKVFLEKVTLYSGSEINVSNNFEIY